MKKDARIKSLVDRINYGNALLNSLQLSRFKVVYAGIGTIIKAAILRANSPQSPPIFVDTSLYYYVPENTEEAYYLLGYLNSRILTEHLRIIGSTGAGGSLRNIHKHPFKFNFPRFNSNNPVHRKLAHMAREIEHYVHTRVSKLIVADPSLKSRIKTLQNRIITDPEYKSKIKTLDKVVMEIFINS